MLHSDRRGRILSRSHRECQAVHLFLGRRLDPACHPYRVFLSHRRRQSIPSIRWYHRVLVDPHHPSVLLIQVNLCGGIPVFNHPLYISPLYISSPVYITPCIYHPLYISPPVLTSRDGFDTGIQYLQSRY